MDARYARQILLREIGEAGQARLAKARVVVRGAGLAAEIEARYLARAGIGEVCVEANERADAPPFEAYDDDARAIAEGAWRAVRAIRGALRCG